MNLIKEWGFKLCDIAVVDIGYRDTHLSPEVTVVLELMQGKSFPMCDGVIELWSPEHSML